MINAWQRNLLLRKSATRQDVHVLLERSTSPSAVAEQCISGTQQGSRAVMVFFSQRCYMDNFQLEYDARHAGRPVGGCHGSFYINWSSPRDRERERKSELCGSSRSLSLSLSRSSSSSWPNEFFTYSWDLFLRVCLNWWCPQRADRVSCQANRKLHSSKSQLGIFTRPCCIISPALAPHLKWRHKKKKGF